MTTLGASFLGSVRMDFRDLFARYRFKEVGEHDDLNVASLTVRNDSQYLRISCDFRDRFITVAFGRLLEGAVPPVPIAPARTADAVREIPSGILLWEATGDKEGAFAEGSYADETGDAIAAAVRRLAAALATHGTRLLAGDYHEWNKLAELVVTRELRR